MSRTPTSAPTAASQAFRRTARGDDSPRTFDPSERRHPRFNLFERHWRFLHEAYVGGPEYIFKGIASPRPVGDHASAARVGATNLFKYFKEGDGEYSDRMLRAHRTNYVKKVVDQIRSFVAKKPPTRRVDAASEVVRRVWDNADGRGRDIDRVMGSVLQWAEVFGTLWVMIDKPRERFLDFESELDYGLPYLKRYFPFDVLDAGFTDRGVLKWIMVRDSIREDDDPMAPPRRSTVYTIWDRRSFRAFKKAPRERGDPSRVVVVPVPEMSGEHGLGIVPFHQVQFSDSEDPFVAPGLVDDIAYLDRDVFNKQSQLDTIVLDQTFSQLAMPADAVIMNDPGRAEENSGDIAAARTNQHQEARRRVIEMGTKRVFLFNGNASHAPAFISPDADQVDAIRQIIKDEVTEIYRVAGLLGEVGREVRTQSGTSKAYDFDRLNKVLAFIASELEFTEWWIALVTTLWMTPSDTAQGVVDSVPMDLVSYPDDFDITGLLEELDIAMRGEEVDFWSPTARAEVRKRLIQKQFPNASAAQLREIFKEVDARLEREKQAAERATDPAMDPDMDPNRPDERDPSARGAGGGARPPGGGPPTRPTTQQSASGEREEDDQRASR